MLKFPAPGATLRSPAQPGLSMLFPVPPPAHPRYTAHARRAPAAGLRRRPYAARTPRK
jgi:hypothetical protein